MGSSCFAPDLMRTVCEQPSYLYNDTFYKGVVKNEKRAVIIQENNELSVEIAIKSTKIQMQTLELKKYSVQTKMIEITKNEEINCSVGVKGHGTGENLYFCLFCKAKFDMTVNVTATNLLDQLRGQDYEITTQRRRLYQVMFNEF